MPHDRLALSLTTVVGYVWLACVCAFLFASTLVCAVLVVGALLHVRNRENARQKHVQALVVAAWIGEPTWIRELKP